MGAEYVECFCARENITSKCALVHSYQLTRRQRRMPVIIVFNSKRRLAVLLVTRSNSLIGGLISHVYDFRILFTANFVNVFVRVALGEREATLFPNTPRRFHECDDIARKHACVFASYRKLIALRERTLGGSVHSCTKLFKMLSIRCRLHA